MPETLLKKNKFPLRLAILLGGSLAILAAVFLVDFKPDLSNLDVRVMSGTKSGNYFALVKSMSEEARSQDGSIQNIESQGSVDNVKRLLSSRENCDTDFALVQDGIVPTEAGGLELIARLPKSESVFILGKSAAKYHQFAELQGVQVGIGPAEGGTDNLARLIFESDDYRPLGLKLVNMSFEEQVQALALGTLELGIFVLDEDAALVKKAVASQGLELTSFEHLDVIARQFSFLGTGRIGAGQYSPLHLLPPVDKRVLRVDTLVIGNGCASRTETIAFLGLLRTHFPTILRHNRNKSGSEFYPLSDDSEKYIINDGPEWADTHVPWLVDIMPIDNWFYVIMGISILFNVMTFGHRFRLWRIDATRCKTQEIFREVLGDKLTPAEIYDLTPTSAHSSAASLAKIDVGIGVINKLRIRCQDHENSMLVPMGQEWAYRFQEEQMEVILTAMRDFRERATMPVQTSEDSKNNV